MVVVMMIKMIRTKKRTKGGGVESLKKFTDELKSLSDKTTGITVTHCLILLLKPPSLIHSISEHNLFLGSTCEQGAKRRFTSALIRSGLIHYGKAE